MPTKDTIDMSLEQRESEEFQKIINRGINEGLGRIARRYENVKERFDNLIFHVQKHTKTAMTRVEKILVALGADEREIGLGKLFTAGHDTVQNYKLENQVFNPEKKRWEAVGEAQYDETQEKFFVNGKEWKCLEDGKQYRIFRKRDIGLNEEKSGDELVAFMEQINREYRKEVFAQGDKETARTAVKVTTPGFDQELGITQPELDTLIAQDPDSPKSRIARAVALADLGTTGMDGPGALLEESKQNFREDNPDILVAAQNISSFSEEEKEAYRQRMVKWLTELFLPMFVSGRKALFERNLVGLSDDVREKVRALFTRFDDSIRAVNEHTEAWKNMSFKELLNDIGYLSKKT